MDLFSLWLDFFTLTAQGVLHILFSARFTGRPLRARYIAGYLLALFLLDHLAIRFSLPWPAAIGAELLLLYGANRLFFGSRPAVSCTTAILALYISQLSFGLGNSVESLLLPRLVRRPLLYLVVAAAAAASIALCALCCALALRWASLAGEAPGGVRTLLFPTLFFLAVELYILQSAYTYAFVNDLTAVRLMAEGGKHAALFFLQLLGLGALFCTLYAYRQLCRSLQVREELRSLGQAARAQRGYFAEAQRRWEQTRAFRHDIQNHLTVLDGLLRADRLEDSRAYLQKLQAVSDELTLPCRTGSPVVDILLGEKLRLARADGTAAEVGLLLPDPCGIEEPDLCVIFANALDNALAACRLLPGKRWVRLRGERQGDLLLVVFENSCPEGPLPPIGTGLRNIRAAAEKYHGAALAEKEGGCFTLSVLLNISLPPADISGQMP